MVCLPYLFVVSAYFTIDNVKCLEDAMGVITFDIGGFDLPQDGFATMDNDSISIFCKRGHPNLISKAVSAFESNVHVNSVKVNFCFPPIDSYVKEFEALNINVTNIEEMHVIFVETEPIPPGDYTVGLKLKVLTLEAWETKETIELFRDLPNFFDPLSSLTFLELHRIHMQRIPYNLRLKQLVIASNASLDDWGSCECLEKLLVQSNENNLPEWPEKCTKLVNLHISAMHTDLNRKIVNLTHAAPYLANLTLASNSLTSLPMDFLQRAKQLQYLDLSENYLYDSAFTRFPAMYNLKTLDVSKTQVKGTFLYYVLPMMPELRRIYMNDNPNLDCDTANLDASYWLKANDYLSISHIEELTFKSTKISINCLFHKQYKHLAFLDLSSAKSDTFSFRELPTTEAETLTIKFNDKITFENMYFTEEDYIELNKWNTSLHNGVHHNLLRVLTTTIDCDCSHGWLVRALRDFPNLLSMPGLRCQHNGVSVLQESPETMECVKEVDENTGCIFRHLWESRIVDAECKTGIVPKKSNLRGLRVVGSNLTDFFNSLPETVQWIDYRNNRLSKADRIAVDTMFLNGRRVWLGQNEIICDCDNRILIDAIQEHHKQVEDYEQLTCIGTGRLIKEESTAVLCQTGLKISMAVLGVLSGLLLILALIYRRYREVINMFLYSRGWCLVCLHKEEFEDKPYDAFISYAHGDDDFVREVLVPGLENSVEKFRLCIHYRDWLVGGWIPAQIMHSVSHSKRTIIVLSNDFIASEWSTLEFRYALAKNTDNDSPRLLILVLDDVLETGNMGPEIESYLAFNTYLRCDDPWFWQKLRYAMPHRGKKKKGQEQKDIRKEDNVEPNIEDMMNMEVISDAH